MLDEENYSSDSSDDDYIPTGADSDVEELTDEPEESSSSDGDNVSEQRSVAQKRKLSSRRSKLKKKAKESVVQGKEDKIKTADAPEDNKEKLDSLWASFKDVTESKEVKEPVTPAVSVPTTSKVYEFAGEEIEIKDTLKIVAPISQQIPGKRPTVRAGGLSNLTSQLSGKKSKLSTLEKSKLDWDQFKDSEGITEDLKSFNQGKKGFLERQAFLERTDVKQFEIEKSIRAGRKPNQ